MLWGQDWGCFSTAPGCPWHGNTPEAPAEPQEPQFLSHSQIPEETRDKMTKGDFIHSGWPSSATTEMTQIIIKYPQILHSLSCRGAERCLCVPFRSILFPAEQEFAGPAKGSRFLVFFAGQCAQSQGSSWQLRSSLENIWKRFWSALLRCFCTSVTGREAFAGKKKGGSECSFSMFAALWGSPRLPPHPKGV